MSKHQTKSQRKLSKMKHTINTFVAQPTAKNEAKLFAMFGLSPRKIEDQADLKWALRAVGVTIPPRF